MVDSVLPPVPVFPQGGSVRLGVRLLDHNGQPQAVNTIRFYVLPPGDVEGRPHSVFQAGGECCAIVELHTPGTWKYRFEKTETPSAVYEGTFVVEKRAVPPPE